MTRPGDEIGGGRGDEIGGGRGAEQASEPEPAPGGRGTPPDPGVEPPAGGGDPGVWAEVPEDVPEDVPEAAPDGVIEEGPPGRAGPHPPEELLAEDPAEPAGGGPPVEGRDPDGDPAPAPELSPWLLASPGPHGGDDLPGIPSVEGPPGETWEPAPVSMLDEPLAEAAGESLETAVLAEPSASADTRPGEDEGGGRSAEQASELELAPGGRGTPPDPGVEPPAGGGDPRVWAEVPEAAPDGVIEEGPPGRAGPHPPEALLAEDPAEPAGGGAPVEGRDPDGDPAPAPELSPWLLASPGPHGGDDLPGIPSVEGPPGETWEPAPVSMLDEPLADAAGESLETAVLAEPPASADTRPGEDEGEGPTGEQARPSPPGQTPARPEVSDSVGLPEAEAAEAAGAEAAGAEAAAIEQEPPGEALTDGAEVAEVVTGEAAREAEPAIVGGVVAPPPGRAPGTEVAFLRPAPPAAAAPGGLVERAGAIRRLRAVATLAVVVTLASAGLAAVVAITVATVAVVIRRAAGG